MADNENEVDEQDLNRCSKTLTRDSPNTREDYREIAVSWRDLVCSGKVNGVDVLPLPDNQFAHLTLRYSEGGVNFQFTAKFRMEDLYLVAIKNSEGNWFALGGGGVGQGAEQLTVNISHGSLLENSKYTSLSVAPLTCEALNNSIMTLSKLGTDPTRPIQTKYIARSCLCIVLLFSEASRFNPILNAAMTEWEDKENSEKRNKSFMDKMIDCWIKLSKIRLNTENRDKIYRNDKLKGLEVTDENFKPVSTVKKLNKVLAIAKQQQRQRQHDHGGQEKDEKSKGKVSEGSKSQPGQTSNVSLKEKGGKSITRNTNAGTSSFKQTLICYIGEMVKLCNTIIFRGDSRESREKELADELRETVADEFIKRRADTEWFVEGDFDTYVARMRQPHVWGGEPELLMSSHVLRIPITVHMWDKKKKCLKVIAEYGQEYGKENPIRVLYHGYGHYDALQSKLFVEGDFDTYVARMRQPHVWGGEPELLMSSHVLRIPITVHMWDKKKKCLKVIAEYGQEYGKENPIRVLYHGYGHYDALQSKLNKSW